MGLDAVELVMDIEDRFRIALPDSECSRVRTVADLAALVISRLPKAKELCPTARSFVSVRSTLAKECGIDRRTLRPTSPLEVVFPRETRRVRWKLLAKTQPHLPRLGLTDAVRRGVNAVGVFLLFLWLPALVLLLVEFGVLGGVIAFFAFTVGAITFVAIREKWAHEFPVGCETLGDLVRLISPESMPSDGGRRLIAEQEISDRVQSIIAEQLGLKREKVTIESRLVEDLGMG
jgi:acyl carrier protein